MSTHRTEGSLASERTLNDALVTADISCGYEGFLAIFDRFYSEDVELLSATHPSSLRGTAQVLPLLFGLLVPLQLMVERGSLSVSAQYFPMHNGEKGHHQTKWKMELLDVLGRHTYITWTSARRWNGARVIYERHDDLRHVRTAILPSSSIA
jgi:hypothetical protein